MFNNILNQIERSKMGGLAMGKILNKQKKERTKKYNKNPKICKRSKCNNPISYEKQNKVSFCSHSCATSFNNKGRPKITKICENCNNLTKRDKFCSQECYIDFKFKRNKRLFYLGLLSNPPKLRKTMIKIFGNKCWICKLEKWLDKNIPINVDHIDGHSENNNPENLRLLCLNCHGQTPTFGSKNMGNGRKSRRKITAGIEPTS